MTTIPADVLRLASQLRGCLGPLVRRIRQVQTEGELTLSQVAVLARLDRGGPATPGALAAGEHIRPQSVAATIGALQELGLVSRGDDPDDGRRVVVAITKAGRAWVQGYRQEGVQRLGRTIFEELTPDEQGQLMAAIPLLERLGEVI